MKRLWHLAVPAILLAAACLAAPPGHAQPRAPSPTAEQRHTDEINCAKVSPDGRMVAACSDDCTVKLWDVATSKLRNTLHHPRAVYGLAFSPDANMVATASGRTVRVWQTGAGRLVRSLDGGPKLVSQLAWSPDGRSLACASGEKFRAGVLKVWGTRTWRRRWQVEAWDTDALRYSPDSKVLACCDGGHLLVWDALHGDEKLDVNIRGYGFTDEMAFSPDSRRIAIALHERDRILMGKVRIVDVRQKRIVRETVLGPDDARCVALLADGRTAAVGSGDGRFVLWDTATGSRRTLAFGARGHHLWLRRLPSGRYVVLGYGEEPTAEAADDDGAVLLWDWKTRKLLCRIQAQAKDAK